MRKTIQRHRWPNGYPWPLWSSPSNKAGTDFSRWGRATGELRHLTMCFCSQSRLSLHAISKFKIKSTLHLKTKSSIQSFYYFFCLWDKTAYENNFSLKGFWLVQAEHEGRPHGQSQNFHSVQCILPALYKKTDKPLVFSSLLSFWTQVASPKRERERVPAREKHLAS